MPRANRHFLPNHVWHLTHRCHEKAFLLGFERDRYRYLDWLYEAKKRFGLCLLDYMVTSNHIHLLVKGTGEDVIARSMQLVASRTAQEYNQRKGRQGAFWEDRYHATAVESDEHLQRCLVYIDLNMVRAGAVKHPAEWEHSGYHEIQAPPPRYRLIDTTALRELCGFEELTEFRKAHRQWVEEALARDRVARDERWSESIAVGSKAFVEKVQAELGTSARHRGIDQVGDAYALREPHGAYSGIFSGRNEPLRPENALVWEQSLEDSET